MRCTCGREVKNHRGLMTHIAAGCPDAIYDLFLDGYTIEFIARKFKKPLSRIETIIRKRAIRESAA